MKEYKKIKGMLFDYQPEIIEYKNKDEDILELTCTAIAFHFKNGQFISIENLKSGM